jgi:hypothetical protein
MLKSQASQKFVSIKEIHDGLIVLNDGSLRAVIVASSVNLSLKSNDEQQAILFQFQAFLNSIDFSVQISIQSRKLDIEPYLELMEEKMKEQNEQLLKIQTREYIDFIKRFTELNNVMTKHFFVVIPYSTQVIQSSGFLNKIFPTGSSQPKEKKMEQFEENRLQLEQRVSIVQQGLSRLGVRSRKLDTDVAVEVFYKIYNPGEGGTTADFND